MNNKELICINRMNNAKSLFKNCIINYRKILDEYIYNFSKYGLMCTPLYYKTEYSNICDKLGTFCTIDPDKICGKIAKIEDDKIWICPMDNKNGDIIKTVCDEYPENVISKMRGLGTYDNDGHISSIDKIVSFDIVLK